MKPTCEVCGQPGGFVVSDAQVAGYSADPSRPGVRFETYTSYGPSHVFCRDHARPSFTVPAPYEVYAAAHRDMAAEREARGQHKHAEVLRAEADDAARHLQPCPAGV